jgi:hypothetical protein
MYGVRDPVYLNPRGRPGNATSFAGEEEKDGRGQIFKCHFRLGRGHGGESAETRCTKSAQKRGYERTIDLITP